MITGSASFPGHLQGRYARSTDASPAVKKNPEGAVNDAEDKKIGRWGKSDKVASSNPDLKVYREVIYGSDTVSPPSAAYTPVEQEQRIDDYAKRVKARIDNLDSPQVGERSFKFQSVRSFMEPAGYFSGGLLAAGYDPHEKITVTFKSYVGKGRKEHLVNTERRTYAAWEIAAGALAHDKPAWGGLVNFNSMVIDPKDRSKISGLEAIGRKLQDSWARDIAQPMGDASGTLAKLSGESDAYVLRGTLQSLLNDKENFKNLSPAGQTAVKRTLEENGQIIIPNIYGYPLEGYAFIPYTPYDGDYNAHRPNEGLMIDLRNGSVREIQGDQAFANWAKDNRDNLLRRFNARDRQGGQDAHWPKAGDVLHNLISGVNAHYPGRHNLLSDEGIPVSETFNYTRSRDGDYELKYDNLKGIASKFQDMNAKNTLWSDQTQVFGSSQQAWKDAKDLWGNTFGYIPVVGTVGNIVFGAHDSIYGMTANDRVGGSAGAVISALQLVHELGPTAVEASLGEPPVAFSSAKNYGWRYSAQTNDFELMRASNASKVTDEAPVNTPGTSTVKPGSEASTSFPGMREVEFEGKKYFVADEPDAGDGHYVLRVRDPQDPDKLASSGKIAKEDAAGVWKRRGVAGGTTEPVRLKELVDGTNLQRPATPDQMIELSRGPDGRYTFTSLDSRFAAPMRDGAYAFVVRADEPDKVYLGSMNKGLTPEGKPYSNNVHTNPDFIQGHSALSNGLKSMKGGSTDVLYAGTVYFKDGEPQFWTNASGHYQPPGELRHTNLTPNVKSILPEGRFVEEDGLSAAQRKAWRESTHLTKEEKEEADWFIKNQYASNESGNEISDSDSEISDGD